ncbi:alanine--tRNA ligase [filamentous cyanobacterium LEGE 11480]|uniref:Alanine--tRNA ligase n=1 Tax=Romeriopsis navalis LEGE 11480 TaxID=2777977 RepID=A0A928Z391_9CYAN|nr:alanine--tRNA ligase [Romeriopsis navalis]MBE9028938.1 alanine--tRNA ligase [Romeriopsis navalis LEGE 11480]
MTTSLSGQQIRQKFLDFFASKDHKALPSASLVPADPTVLLTIAGMLPFKPIFLGQQKPDFPRATTSQKCIRTNDIENVGRTARHHTFFEMLGNFSFGDYFKSQAIAYGWEVSTKVFGIKPENIVVSVFEEDDEALAIWRDEVGVNPKRIVRMGAKDNFWVSGPTGPCGPCSELYYDFKPELGDDDIDPDDDSRFIEFYNLVFMQYNRDAAGKLTPLAKQNIDTGMGLERMAQILQGVPNNYETDLIFPIIETAAKLAGIKYKKANESAKTSLKVIGDHVRAVTHLISDGVVPSNEGRGYVLRRLIRRVVRHGRLIGIEGLFTTKVAETAIKLSESQYPDVRKQADLIKAELQAEEERFLKTIERGEKLLEEVIAKTKKQISGVDAFELYDTYGFPLELTQEIAEEKGLKVDAEGFEAEMEKQRDRARSAHKSIDLTVQGSLDKLASDIEVTDFLGYTKANSKATVELLLQAGEPVDSVVAGSDVQIILDKTPFYAESGGQIGDQGYLSSGDTVVRIEDVQKESGFFIHIGRIERGSLKKGDAVTAQIDLACRRRAQANHSATHLLQAALKKLVDEKIGQAGSLVSFDRLRFDYNYNKGLTPEQLQAVEAQINTWISEAHGADIAEMAIADAKAKGATAMFGEKYGDSVRVVDFPGVSMELCGGIHVSNTAEIGVFKIISETGVAAGIRRIEAVAGPAVLEYLNVREAVVKDLSDRFKAKPEEIVDRVTAMQAELKDTQKQMAAMKAELAAAKSGDLVNQAIEIGDFKAIIAELPGADADSLKSAAETLLQKLGEGAIVLGASPAEGKVNFIAAFSKGVVGKGLQAGKVVGSVAKICGGGGGGRPNFAQAGGRDASKLAEALAEAEKLVKGGLG